MSTPVSPRTLRAGLVLADPNSGSTQQVIVLQYSPESLSRSLQPQAVGAESGDRVDALRLKAPPVETYKIDAELDATDQMATAAGAPNGLLPQLAALEMLVTPSVSTLRSNQALAMAGTLEIVPVMMPLTLFVWGRNRILPVRITEYSVTEDAFDPQLNPIRARVSLSLRVLNVNDLVPGSRGSELYLAHQSQMEALARKFAYGSAADVGLTR
ncbi:hypothetical protein Terro_2512 [Terriglobus roseus DSM 18391]|uniref:Uncharacterized protein n=1 Tax=Terriglobus roseus (strain DSM 18391 / NRRL B-41598 / KBS 63) TaxID=926566 RepID=I3ZGQ0_TERRK|nr:hypothetical protein [Terriglobus roseus]AFL88418.1 hypothetical protein Terro_2148 [Terriglobus roseus DSM 18391]AFL88758.1 hypothetical protein Terro_2512 [Terriglobus roseus DSM 18391]